MEAKYEAKIIQKSFFIPFQSSGMNEWAPMDQRIVNAKFCGREVSC